MAFLVRLVQTYSVFKQIAKSICNEYSICFSSQNLPYSGASDFVKVCYAHHLQHIKKPKAEKSALGFLVRRKGHSCEPSSQLTSLADYGFATVTGFTLLAKNSPPDCFLNAKTLSGFVAV
ncbi:hypothetical protein [uncultured Eubacterium sp.]|uniref:hypothetical protein n=1 Tax=uncultured Eubacterium sp. TaxID=165185 RepID=UPI0015AEFD78|nr:hypothetical protein [uncultured Eubacterium sp.]